jgi:hypothetical protein
MKHADVRALTLPGPGVWANAPDETAARERVGSPGWRGW